MHLFLERFIWIFLLPLKKMTCIWSRISKNFANWARIKYFKTTWRPNRMWMYWEPRMKLQGHLSNVYIYGNPGLAVIWRADNLLGETRALLSREEVALLTRMFSRSEGWFSCSSRKHYSLETDIYFLTHIIVRL